MSKFLMNEDYKQLLNEGVPEDLIRIILSTKYPEHFNLEEIQQNIADENEFIRDMMIAKGFKPFHIPLKDDEINSLSIINATQSEATEESQSEAEAEAECKATDECEHQDRRDETEA